MLHCFLTSRHGDSNKCQIPDCWEALGSQSEQEQTFTLTRLDLFSLRDGNRELFLTGSLSFQSETGPAAFTQVTDSEAGKLQLL